MALPTSYDLIKKHPRLVERLKIEDKKLAETAIAVCPDCEGKLFFVLNEPKSFPRGKRKGKFRYRFICAECGSEVFYWER